MPLRLYMDHDSLDKRVIAALRAAEIDVLTSEETGNRRLSDELQLQFATDQARIIYSANVGDFARIHGQWLAAGRTHGGIVVRAIQLLSVGDQIRGLTRIGQSVSDEECRNLFAFVEGYVRES